MFKTCSKVKSTEAQNNSDSDEMMLINISDEKMGFIMMECGFEGISLKVWILRIVRFQKFLFQIYWRCFY